jgi:hypothetical protein
MSEDEETMDYPDCYENDDITMCPDCGELRCFGHRPDDESDG